jgi:polyribonucleotide nucleotidyltransferase
VKAVYDEAVAHFCPADAVDLKLDDKQVKEAVHKVEKALVRENILKHGKRPDGRKLDEVRPLNMEVGWLPRTHGSSLFARGETQAMVTVTLGTSRDEQTVDELMNYYSKKFMLHYNFPPFSVGEARRIAGPGRREMGHGALAEKSLEAVLPDPEQFPYTIRVVSDILESNGSSSMASVCGGSICLMDAGVPISGQVAGISVGIVEDNGKWELLTDILGEEDHFGDMDFKVAGTKDGVTGVQLDLKKRGLSQEQIAESMKRARTALTFILGKMNAIIDKPRAEISTLAPRILMVKVNPEKIGKIIGPAGKGIRALEADTGAKIDIEDDGKVKIASSDALAAQQAADWIRGLTSEPEVGVIYTGTVVRVVDFGAFIKFLGAQDGLCHISELRNERVGKVTDVVKEGDTVKVKVLSVDDRGKVKLTMRGIDQVTGEETEPVERRPAPEGQGEGRRDRGPRRHHRHAS